VATEARRRVEPAVNPVLHQIIAPVGQRHLGRTLIFVARLQLIFMRMAIGTEGLFMANIAGLLILGQIEFMPRNVICRMVHRRLVVGMTIAAEGRRGQLYRVQGHHALCLRACKEDKRDHQKEQQKGYLYRFFLHVTSLPFACPR